jgi:hypothetical protein
MTKKFRQTNPYKQRVDMGKLFLELAVETGSPIEISNNFSGLRYTHACAMMPLINKSLEEMPLHISDSNPAARAFAKWRIKVAR